ncbi:hypothetical protein [Agromyces bauzanensis]
MHGRRAAALMPILAIAFALTGCASAASTFDDAVGQGIAAVETARLAVDQQLDGRTFDTTAITTLGDARRELVAASTTVSQTDATTTADAALRADVLDALADGVEAVNDARDAMAGIGALEEVVPELEQAADQLEALEARTAASADAGGAP